MRTKDYEAEYSRTVRIFLASVFLLHILEVELGLTGPTSISTNIRTTCSKSLAVFVSNDSSLSVRPRILFVVELAIAEMACVSSNVRRTFHVPSGVRVQRSISGRDVSHPRTVSCFCFRILIGCLGILGLLHRRMVVVSHLFRPQRS